VQIGKLGLQLHVIVRGAGDVARAARAGTGGVEGRVHGGEHGRVLAHAQIIVGAPDGDLALIVGLVAVNRGGEPPGNPFDIGKHPIAFFLPKRVHGVFENSAIVHHIRSSNAVPRRRDTRSAPRVMIWIKPVDRGR
jgi:hypothetical protein